MSQRQDLRLSGELLAAYLEGEVPTSEREAIEAALRDDPRAQRKLEQMQHIASCLSAPVAELDDLDLAARVKAELAKPQVEPPAAPRRGLAWASALALVASGGLFFAWRTPPSDESEFRAKSANVAGQEADRWAGIEVHRALTASTLEPLGKEMSKGDGLVFSYTNVGPSPFRYLMIFAVDARGEVRWFYPAYERAGEDPASIVVDPRAQVSLGDLISHDYAEGPLAIHALFTRTPLHVSEVERWLVRSPQGLEHAPVEDASLQVIRIRVVR